MEKEPFLSSDSTDDDRSVDSNNSDHEEGLSSRNDSDLKQHGLAVIISLIATILSYTKLSNSIEYSASKIFNEEALQISEGGGIAHHAGYRRTAGINFCEEDELQQQKNTNDNIQRFQFEFPPKFNPIMISYFEEDDQAEKALMDEHPDFFMNTTFEPDQNIQCIHAIDKVYTYGTSSAFIAPKIDTFYQLTPPKNHISGRPVKEASNSFTGFAAKFYNLSPKTLDLWWDGGSGTNRKRKKIARVSPFESVGTSTHNGQSFSFTPTYDGDHNLIRFIVTSDDAISVYDAIKDTESNGKQIKLTDKEQKLYDGQLLNLLYGRSYIVKTGRHWLSAFPRPPPKYHIYPSKYFGQKHKVETQQTHFINMPPKNQLERLDIDSYKSRPSVSLREFRKNGEALNLILKTVSCTPRVFEIDNFLSSIEVDHILELASSLPVGSSLNSRTTLRGEPIQDGNKSVNPWLDRGSSPIMDAIYRRVADVVKIDESLLRHREGYEHTELASDHSIAEAMQLEHYKEGQNYVAQHDFIYPGMSDRYQPYRFCTIMFFLNDEMEGGEAVFPRSVTAESHSGIEIIPKKGKALLFYNMLEDGNVDSLSQHASNEVLKGEKWIANMWIWDPIIN